MPSDAAKQHIPLYDVIDRGCWVHSACLSCPLPVCIHDMDKAAQKAFKKGIQERNAELIKAYWNGGSVDKLAVRFGISRRSVFRILREGYGKQAATI